MWTINIQYWSYANAQPRLLAKMQAKSNDVWDIIDSLAESFTSSSKYSHMSDISYTK